MFVRVREPAGGKARLRREGTTIHSDVDVSYVDAILGTTVLVDTVDGNVDLKVPPGTQPGTTLVMSKRGVPKLGAAAGVRGDHHVHVRVTIPTKVGGEERKLVEQLREATKAAPAAGSRHALTEGIAPPAKRPPFNATWSPIARRVARACAKRASACTRRVSPAGVRVVSRRPRLNRRAPSSASSLRICSLKAACARFSLAAARVKLRWRAASRKYSSW